jgi:hypothetical protein
VRAVTSSCDASLVDDDCTVGRTQPRVQNDTEGLRVDLLGVGAGFEDETVALAYPAEIDICG